MFAGRPRPLAPVRRSRRAMAAPSIPSVAAGRAGRADAARQRARGGGVVPLGRSASADGGRVGVRVRCAGCRREGSGSGRPRRSCRIRASRRSRTPSIRRPGSATIAYCVARRGRRRRAFPTRVFAISTGRRGTIPSAVFAAARPGAELRSPARPAARPIRRRRCIRRPGAACPWHERGLSVPKSRAPPRTRPRRCRQIDSGGDAGWGRSAAAPFLGSRSRVASSAARTKVPGPSASDAADTAHETRDPGCHLEESA